MKNFFIGLLTIFALCAVPDAQAHVSLKNGNFFIGYKDVLYSGGFEPKIERIYNSKTPYRGMFGWGWGSEYEVRLEVSADGSVVVHEYGGGAENRFSPVGFTQAELQAAVKTIADTARAAGALGSQQQYQGYITKLTRDAVFRNDEWQKFVSQGRLKPRSLKDGSKLTSSRFSYQSISKVKGGYVRTFENGKTERFNESGRIVQISDSNSNFIQFAYTNDGKLQQLQDNFHRKMFFQFNSQGLLQSVTAEGGKKSEYAYNKLGELIQSKDVDGNVYKYAYSSDGRHNLTQISYTDGTSLNVAYYDRKLYENVRSVTERDGTLTQYQYDYSKIGQGIYSVASLIKDKAGRTLTNSRYEYHLKSKQTGEEWTHRMISTIDGERIDTVYNEKFGLPETITRGSEVSSFRYDDKGRVLRKETPIDLTVLAYDPKSGKVSKVVHTSKATKRTRTSEFQYDAKGNLSFAKNSDQEAVRLVYDRNGRISSMIDQTKKRIDFKYNENSKPIEIIDHQLGTIKVTYTQTGEVKSVESTGGRRIASQVSAAFQNLLDIIRPAGVSLTF